MDTFTDSGRHYKRVRFVRGVTYVVMQPTFLCCGIIEEWHAYIKESGTITFDLWRGATGGLKLVGTMEYTAAAANTEITFSVPTGSRYTVLPNDYIGWYTRGKEMIAYKPEPVSIATQAKYFMLRPRNIAIGETLDWSSATTVSANTYAIRARYGVNSYPNFVNLDAEIRVIPPVTIGSTVYTVSATDPDISDTTITQLIYGMTTSSSYFSFDNTTKEVKASQTLKTAVGYHCLTFTIQDICLNVATGRLCIFIHNDPPSATCNPNTALVSELTTQQTSIITVTTSDINGDTVTCSLTRTDPSGSPFSLQNALSTGAFTIDTNVNPNFRAATRDIYTIYITCTDGKNATRVQCGVRILPSQPPMFTNMPTLVTMSTSNVKSDTVYDVKVSDVDSQTFNYSITCVPANCPFTIFNTGHIQLNKDLSDHIVGGYDVYVTVTDGYNTVSSTLSVTISGINVAPKFTNLPRANILAVPENTSPGSSIYQVSATDNNNDILTYSMTSSPVTGANYFTIESTSGLISTLMTSVLNFEAMTDKLYTISVRVSDGKLTTPSMLVIQVLDVNEGLSFSQNEYRIVANESVAGTQLPSAGFVVTDFDTVDYVRYSLDCGANSGYLRININSGLLTFAVDYSLDVPGKPDLLTCIITATDKGGLTATTTLTIKINEINDHVPTFQYSSYTFYAYNNAAVGFMLGNVSATDADSGTNGNFVLSSDQSGLPENYFSVSSSGQVTIQRSLYKVPAGTELAFIIYATDAGHPSLQGDTNVRVIVLEGSTTTVPTTTSKYKTFFSDERNIAWFALALITGFVVVAITVFICWRYVGDWPSNIDLFKNCTQELRKLDCCKNMFRKSNDAEYLPESSPKQKSPEVRWRSSPSPSPPSPVPSFQRTPPL
ncbi:hypothetical protein ACJMK2_035982, partial [Sinanodonta woodiana]